MYISFLHDHPTKRIHLLEYMSLEIKRQLTTINNLLWAHTKDDTHNGSLVGHCVQIRGGKSGILFSAPLPLIGTVD